MSRADLSLILAGTFMAASLLICWYGNWVIAFVCLAGVGGALAYAAENTE